MAKAVSIDLTEAVAEEPWAERALGILLEVAESMSSADGVDSALNRLAWLALRASGADRSAIFVLDPEVPNRLLPAAGASRSGDLAELWQRFRSMDPIEIDPDVERLAPLGVISPTTIEDVAASTFVPEKWKHGWRSKSVAYAPLFAGGEMFGALAVDYVWKRHAFSPGEVKLLEAISGAAGLALRSAKLVEDLQRAVAIERRLGECTAALQSGRSLAEILDVVADRFVSLIPEVSCAIVLLSPDGAVLTPVAFRGITPRGDLRISELPAAEVSAFQEVWARDPGKPIVIPDVRAYSGWERFIPPEIGTGMLVPLPEGREIRGFVTVGRPEHPFSDEEVRVATAFAGHAALAIAQARLTDTLQLRLKVIEALYRLADTVVRTSDLKSVLWALNREIDAEVGIECRRLSFGDAGLAELLGVPAATAEERALLRSWRRDGGSSAVVGDELAVCVLLQHRPSGILWVRAATEDPTRLELVKAIAAGIGEVAYKAKLRRTAERRSQELAVADDRERIARDLHDTVGQTLYGIGLKLQDVLCEVEDRELQDRLGALRALAAQGVADVRSAVYALSFLHVRDRGFIPSLRALTRQFGVATGVDARLRVSGPIPALSEEVESALFRMTHEALVNVERHARATGVVVALAARDRHIELSIRDDGVGLGQREVADWQSAAHFGMRTMAKSIEQAGGRFRVSLARPRGLVITASVPYDQRAAAR